MNTSRRRGMPSALEFSARIRHWNPEAGSGLAVADIPARFVEALGGRRQMRLSGTLDGKRFSGATMLVKGGGFCIGITKDAMRAAGVEVGDKVTLALRPAARKGAE